MNGPEHYTEAERFLTDALDEYTREGGPIAENVTSWLAIAQTHATLALVAAAADARVRWQGDGGSTTYAGDHDAWIAAFASSSNSVPNGDDRD